MKFSSKSGIAVLVASLSSGPAPAQYAVATTAPSATAPSATAPSLTAPANGVAPDPVEALGRYLRVLAVYPRNLDALTGAARSALTIGDANAAIGFFARAQDIAPGDGRIKAGLASALVQMEQPKTALKLFDQAVALGVPEAEIASDRGLAYDLRGDPRRAQQDYALALRTRADDETTRRLAVSQGISGDKAAAMATLDAQLRRQDRAAWRVRAFVLAMTGDREGAELGARNAMQPAQAQAIMPYLGRLANLSAAQKAAAVHLGQFPSEGRSASQQEMYASVATAAPIRSALPVPQPAAVARPAPVPQSTTVPGASLVPSGQAFGTPPTSASIIAPASPSGATNRYGVAPPPASAPSQAANRYGSAAYSAAAASGVTPVPTRASVATASVPITSTATATAISPATVAAGAQSTISAAANPSPATLASNAGGSVAASPAAAQAAVPQLPAASTYRAMPVAQPNGVAPVDIPPSAASAANVAPSQAAPSASAAMVRAEEPARPTAQAPTRFAERYTAPVAPAADHRSGTVERKPVRELQQETNRTAGKAAKIIAPKETDEKAAPKGAAARSAAAKSGKSDASEKASEKTAAKADKTKPGTKDKLAAKDDDDSKVAKGKGKTTASDKSANSDKSGKQGKSANDAKTADAGKSGKAKDDKDDKGEKATDKAGGERYWVQVASGSNKSDLDRAWDRTRAKAPKLLNGRSTYTAPWKSSNRLLVGPFKTDEEAQKFVNALSKSGTGAMQYTSRAGAKVDKLGD